MMSGPPPVARVNLIARCVGCGCRTRKGLCDHSDTKLALPSTNVVTIVQKVCRVRFARVSCPRLRLINCAEGVSPRVSQKTCHSSLRFAVKARRSNRTGNQRTMRRAAARAPTRSRAVLLAALSLAAPTCVIAPTHRCSQVGNELCGPLATCNTLLTLFTCQQTAAACPSPSSAEGCNG